MYLQSIDEYGIIYYVLTVSGGNWYAILPSSIVGRGFSLLEESIPESMDFLILSL